MYMYSVYTCIYKYCRVNGETRIQGHSTNKTTPESIHVYMYTYLYIRICIYMYYRDHGKLGHNNNFNTTSKTGNTPHQIFTHTTHTHTHTHTHTVQLIGSLIELSNCLTCAGCWTHTTQYSSVKSVLSPVLAEPPSDVHTRPSALLYNGSHRDWNTSIQINIQNKKGLWSIQYVYTSTCMHVYSHYTHCTTWNVSCLSKKLRERERVQEREKRRELHVHVVGIKNPHLLRRYADLGMKDFEIP